MNFKPRPPYSGKDLKDRKMKYRILVIYTTSRGTIYFPQVKWLHMWWNIQWGTHCTGKDVAKNVIDIHKIKQTEKPRVEIKIINYGNDDQSYKDAL